MSLFDLSVTKYSRWLSILPSSIIDTPDSTNNECPLTNPFTESTSYCLHSCELPSYAHVCDSVVTCNSRGVILILILPSEISSNT